MFMDIIDLKSNPRKNSFKMLGYKKLVWEFAKSAAGEIINEIESIRRSLTIINQHNNRAHHSKK
jgi:hypothetical protein